MKCSSMPTMLTWYIVDSNQTWSHFCTLYTWGYFSQEHAYPADELMPLTCKGRVRGLDRGRGDIDEALGR